MPKRRGPETLEDRNLRLAREALMKKNEAAANEAAVDQMIRRNIEQYGP